MVDRICKSEYFHRVERRSHLVRRALTGISFGKHAKISAEGQLKRYIEGARERKGIFPNAKKTPPPHIM